MNFGHQRMLKTPKTSVGEISKPNIGACTPPPAAPAAAAAAPSRFLHLTYTPYFSISTSTAMLRTLLESLGYVY